MGINCLKTTGPLQEDSLLFTTKSPGTPGNHLMEHGKMKGWVKVEPPSDIEPGTRQIIQTNLDSTKH